jgi:23S rRNA (cytosine1962-C5)-methyltransferase
MKNFPRVVLHPAKERSIKLFHPWIFSGAIRTVESDVKEGDIVEVFSNDGSYLATGHFHEGSIKVRIFSFERTAFDHDFWKEKFSHALDLRIQLGLIANPLTNTFRFIHGEGDGLPGLIVDIYGSCAVVQAHTVGMYNALEQISSALISIPELGLKTVYNKSDDTLQKQTEVESKNRHLFGDKNDDVVLENGIKLYVNWVEGQKTGFFIDQRENRNLLKQYAEGKKMLNTFSYSGGFSLYGLAAGARTVHSIDSSLKAKDWAEKNVELNGYQDRHRFFKVDAFDYLKSCDELYDLIVLDPPAFAKHLSSAKKAIIGYRNLNTEGFKRVAPKGILFTFSCSQVIDKQMFRKIVFQAAAQSGRNVKVLHQLSQGPDHPVSIYHPEGEYLKGLVLYVE